MTKEEILNKLKDSFKDFQFFEEGHYYECKGKRVGISVTRLIEEYTNEFNAEEMAEKVANKENRLVEDILAEWKYKADFACAKGSTCHEYAQSLWSKSIWKYIPFGQDIAFKLAVNKIKKQAKNFKFEYENHLEHLIDELPIGSEEFDIASCVDHLFYNKLTGGLVLVDYKTNSYMSGYNKKAYSKKMKVPLNHLNDDALHHYHIQLSIYKYLIEKYTGLKVEEMFIVYMSENIENYEIIDIPYLKEEVEKILENRRERDMKSVSVLIIGKSGSGKSSSLRNLSSDEYSLVNPLKKELPFKTNVKGLESDNYDLIKKFITETPKKIVVLDDSNYLLTNQFMRNHSKGGSGNAVFAVYNELADNYWNLVQHQKNTEGGKIIFNFMHEDETESGNIIPKTVGKLLNDKVCIEGMYTIVLRAMYKDGKHIFRLKTDGNDCVKTPIGMFNEEECENDLKYVIEKIREYYELDKESEEI